MPKRSRSGHNTAQRRALCAGIRLRRNVRGAGRRDRREVRAEFRCQARALWIVEKAGDNVGAVFVVGKSATVAQLRLLLVEPKARGLGIGARLIDESLRFARQAGYRKMVLWTQSNLAAARAIYRKAGFRLARTERHRSFGRDLVGEYWERKL
ncbi:MAG: GNAT family N-acetyltransferase [Betaproteobacteria bacterium]